MVGYGKPPAHSRFAKGQSGNPKGRPRGRSLEALLQAALDETLTIEVKGRRRVSKREAIIAQLVDRSAAADPRSLKLLLDLLQKLEPRRPRDDPPGDQLDKQDAEDPRVLLARKIARVAATMTEEERAAGRAELELRWREQAAETTTPARPGAES